MTMPDQKIDLTVEIGSLHLKNPVMVASGTFGYGEEYSTLIDINELGAIVTKGISLNPFPGNPPPRIVETPSGMLNAIGLQNVGFETFVSEKMSFLKRFNTPVIVNFFGSSVAEYTELARKLSDVEGIAGLEANISCPNIKEGGMCFGTDPSMAHSITKQIRKATKLPLIVKLTPNVTDISTIAASVEEAGADAVSLTNTFTGMVVDVESCRPELSNITGGLSGPAIRPLSLRMVWETVRKVSIPVIGIGGIMDEKDALQYLIAGAMAVQIGTGLFVNPNAPHFIIKGIESYLRVKGYTSVQQIIGCLKTE
jgi:dihydroorotate dehydrogenase (NAD+) catalytic subunit